MISQGVVAGRAGKREARLARRQRQVHGIQPRRRRDDAHLVARRERGHEGGEGQGSERGLLTSTSRQLSELARAHLEGLGVAVGVIV